MKLNWGNVIAIFIVIFLLTGFSVVFMIVTDKKLDHQLVSKKYYEEELDFQKNKDKIQRGKSISNKIRLESVQKNTLEIMFDRSLNVNEGEIVFYCPFNKDNDFTVKLSLDEEYKQTVISEKLEPGIWEITISFLNRDKIGFIVKNKLLIK